MPTTSVDSLAWDITLWIESIRKWLIMVIYWSAIRVMQSWISKACVIGVGYRDIYRDVVWVVEERIVLVWDLMGRHWLFCPW
jgi:hypothetical protein